MLTITKKNIIIEVRNKIGRHQSNVINIILRICATLLLLSSLWFLIHLNTSLPLHHSLGDLAFIYLHVFTYIVFKDPKCLDFNRVSEIEYWWFGQMVYVHIDFLTRVLFPKALDDHEVHWIMVSSLMLEQPDGLLA